VDRVLGDDHGTSRVHDSKSTLSIRGASLVQFDGVVYTDGKMLPPPALELRF
jgi:hypothetical protein